MNKFVVINFADETKIGEGISVLRKLRGERGMIYSSALVAKDSSGKLSVRPITSEGLGGTAAGVLIGVLAGLPAGPLGAAIGAAGGAAIGIAADLLNQGDEEVFAEEMSRELAPGRAAIAAEVDENGVTAFEALMQAVGGTVVCK